MTVEWGALLAKKELHNVFIAEFYHLSCPAQHRSRYSQSFTDTEGPFIVAILLKFIIILYYTLLLFRFISLSEWVFFKFIYLFEIV